MRNVNQPLGGILTEVRRLRTERGLTLKELAQAAHISYQTIRRMEMSPSERRGGISISSACAVARALEVQVDKLFPNTVLNYTQGRPVQTGVEKMPPRQIQPTATCPNCNTQVSLRETIDGQSECCAAPLAA